MSGSGREAFPDDREWSKCYPECPGVVKGPPRCPGVVGRPSQMSGSGRESCLTSVSDRKAIPNV